MYLLETSKIISLLKNLGKKYRYIDSCLKNFYRDSQAYHLISRAFGNLKKKSKYSFVNRISEIRKEGNAEPLNNSRIVRYWMNWLRMKKNSLSFYLSLSKIAGFIKATVKEICCSPLRAGGIIVILAIMVNVALSFLLKKEIGLFGWVMRGIFLFMGINGFLCNTDWLAIKNNSVVIGLVRKGAK